MEKDVERAHAANLLKLLEGKNPCEFCPWFFTESVYPPPRSMHMDCLDFIGAAAVTRPHNETYVVTCPCYLLGPQEAIKRTWLALEAKGYLD